MERTDIRYALTEAAEDKDLSNRCNEDQKKYSLLRRTWQLVLSMKHIPSNLGHDKDWWNETLTRGMNLKKPFTIVLFAVRSQPEVCCLCLVTAVESVSVHFVFWSLGLLSKKCLLQKWLPLKRSKSNGHFPRTLWSLVSVQLWLRKPREQHLTTFYNTQHAFFKRYPFFTLFFHKSIYCARG